jgi:hypothetical protein
MKLVILAFVSSLLLGGCLVHTRDHHHHGRHGHAKKHKHKKGCHPSQYWDGHKCRHKGKGRGARKHDH